MRTRHLLATAAAVAAATTVLAPLDADAKPEGPGAPVRDPGPQGLVALGGVNAPDTTARDTQVGTSIAVDGKNVVVGWLDEENQPENQSAGWARSGNGGLTFVDQGAAPASPMGDLGPPSLAVDTIGHTFYLASGGSDLEPDSLPVFRSTDGGQTLSAPVDATPQLGTGNVEQRPSITVDNYAGSGSRNVYLCWTHSNGANSNIFFNRSTDQGATYTPGSGLQITPGGNGCQVAVTPNHNVYVFYYRGTGPNGQGGDNKLFVRRSTDRGLTFRPEVVVADLNTSSDDGALSLVGGPESNSFPSVAVDPVTGRLYVAFNDEPTAGTDLADVYLTRSTNGTTWSSPTQANSDDSSREQYQPSVAVSSDGQRLMVGYYSTVNDPTDAAFHRRGRVGTLASNGAVTFSPSFQLGPDTPDLSTFTVPAATDGLTASPGYFHSTWTDDRTGNAFHVRQPDVRYARVTAAQATVQPGVTLSAPTTVTAGSSVAVQATVTNTGPGRAEDVFVNVTLPEGLAAKAVVGNGGAQCDRYRGLTGCYLGSLAAGASRTVDVTALATRTGNLTTKASVTTSSLDTSSADNNTTAKTKVTGGGGTQSVHTTGSIALAVPDGGSVDVPVDVEADGGLLSVQAGVRIDHTYDGDLELSLVSPEGTEVLLSSDNGGDVDNYGTGPDDCTGAKTVFSDSATTDIFIADAPFAGTFRPEEQLATFAGENPQGQWLLRVVDDALDDTGTVGCVDLTIRSN